MRTVTALATIFAFIAALAAIAWGLFSQTFFAHGIAAGQFGWHVFAFTSGLFLLATPATLSFALTIIPLALQRKMREGVVLTFAFSAGSLMTLVAFGFFAGLLGFIGYDVFSYSLQSLSSIGLLILGAFAYVLALAEVDLLRIARSMVGERAIALLSRQRGPVGAFLLGMFLSGMTMHPSTLVLLGGVLLRADPLGGAALLLMHGIGKIIPLLIILSLAALGVDATDWVKSRVERLHVFSGWLLVIVGGILLNIGLHEWLRWLNNAPFITQLLEERWVLASLWLVPLWIVYFRESRRVYGGPLLEWKTLARTIDRAERERRAFFLTSNIATLAQVRHLEEIERKIDELEKKRRIIESGIRHDSEEVLRGRLAQRLEERLLFMRFAFTITCSLLVVLVLSLFVI